MKTHISTEKICQDCLQEIVNGEPRESKEHSKRMDKTLSEWAKVGYTPGGLPDDDYMEGEFYWKHCPLCGDLPGMRYEYLFFYKRTRR